MAPREEEMAEASVSMHFKILLVEAQTIKSRCHPISRYRNLNALTYQHSKVSPLMSEIMRRSPRGSRARQGHMAEDDLIASGDRTACKPVRIDFAGSAWLCLPRQLGL